MQPLLTEFTARSGRLSRGYLANSHNYGRTVPLRQLSLTKYSAESSCPTACRNADMSRLCVLKKHPTCSDGAVFGGSLSRSRISSIGTLLFSATSASVMNKRMASASPDAAQASFPSQ